MDTDIKVITSPKDLPNLIDPKVPSDDFESTLAAIEKDKQKKAEDAKLLAELQLGKLPKPKEIKPITLHYRYEGNCNCGAEVTTLMVDVKNSLFAIAYCPTDHKQILSIEVTPIFDVTKVDSTPTSPLSASKTAEKPEDDILIKTKGDSYKNI
jgi:hypothetical protein